MNHLGIDVLTQDKATLIARLRGLVTTVSVEDGGEYREDSSYSQVWVTTHMTEAELDDWLCTTNLNFIGTFTRRETA